MKKTMIVLPLIMAVNVFALERKDVMPLIEEASGKRGTEYVETRNRIVAFGTNALPFLVEFAVDDALPWQHRLVSRICYERIERKEDIGKLIETDWYSHPKFNPEWNSYLTGPEWHMVDMIVDDLREVGLWYYYLEQEWKMTGEKAKIKNESRNPFLWKSCCTFAVKDSPKERIWFLRICSEFLINADVYAPRAEHLQNFLAREEKPDSAYLLEHRVPPPVPEEPPFRLGSKIIKPAKQP